MLTKQRMTNCTLFLLIFEEINVIAKCGQLSSVQKKKFTNFWCLCMLLNLVMKLKYEINSILL